MILIFDANITYTSRGCLFPMCNIKRDSASMQSAKETVNHIFHAEWIKNGNLIKIYLVGIYPIRQHVGSCPQILTPI